MEQKLQSLSEAKHTSKSELIKEALEMLFGREESQKDSLELRKEYIVRFGSGKSDLSVNYKNYRKEKIRAKHHSD